MKLLAYLVKWLAIAALLAVTVGSASALFLASLEVAGSFRESHLWIIAFLPLSGFLVAFMYHRWGTDVAGGNNLLIDTIREPGPRIQFRMAPFIFLATVATHLFGGSAGREGTALQMAGPIADQLAKPFRLGKEERKLLMIAGIAAGFGSVFGTPLAGAVFALEFYLAGRIAHTAIFPAFAAAFAADWVTRRWGIVHERFSVGDVPALSPQNLLWSVLAGLAFGACAALFCLLLKKVALVLARVIRFAPLRPVAGGILIAAAIAALGTTRWIGLGSPVIAEAFTARSLPWDFALKILFTVVTLGSGFRGGEVTPLFFIGATLGNALAWILPLPFPLLAAMGFAAVFAGASNTPLACLVLGMELFGPAAGPYVALACAVSYLVTGRTSLYSAQRTGSPKLVP